MLARGQLDDVIVDAAVRKRAPFLSLAESPPVARQASPDLVLDDTATATQLAEAVEVADQGHVGVNRVRGVLGTPGLLVETLGRGQQWQIGAQQYHFRAAALRRYTHVKTSTLLGAGHRSREEGIAP